MGAWDKSKKTKYHWNRYSRSWVINGVTNTVCDFLLYIQYKYSLQGMWISTRVKSIVFFPETCSSILDLNFDFQKTPINTSKTFLFNFLLFVTAVQVTVLTILFLELQILGIPGLHSLIPVLYITATGLHDLRQHGMFPQLPSNLNI